MNTCSSNSGHFSNLKFRENGSNKIMAYRAQLNRKTQSLLESKYDVGYDVVLIYTWAGPVPV